MTSLTGIVEVVRDRNCHRRRRARQCIEEEGADNDGFVVRSTSQRDDDDDEDDNPILFSNLRVNRRCTRFSPTPIGGTRTDGDYDDEIIDISYGECIDIIANHERWLIDAIHHDLPPENVVVNENRHNENTTIFDNIIVGYLSDNSPELLLSVLACIKLTSTVDNTPIRPGKRKMKLLPAMIHCRWTPTEIKQAMHPSLSSTNNEGNNTTNHNVRHVTIILYGPGYKHVATEAVRLMNQSHCCCHWAVAMPIPKLTSTRRYSCFNDPNNDYKIEIQSKMKIDDTKKSRRDNHLADGGVSDADALLLFTSGTTSGGGKGVRLSHRSLFVQSHAKLHPPCSYDANTRMVATTVPWFHVGGMSSAIAVMLAGGTLIFPSSVGISVEGDGGGGERKFRLEVIMKKLLPPPPSSFSSSSLESSTMVANTLVVVPAMLHSMVQSAAHSSFPNVRLILVGGQSIVGYGGDGLYDRMRRIFPNARVVQTYACTEAGSSITFEDLTAEVGCGDFTLPSASDGRLDKIRTVTPSDDTSVYSGPGTCVGYPGELSHVQIGIFHIEKAAEAAKAHGSYSLLHLPPQLLLSHGTIGIIGSRGPHVMSGYWNRSIIDGSDDNNIAVDDDHDGWVLTNDLGCIDPVSKKLYFCGRVDDVIRTGGESVLALDVERVIIDFKEDDYIIVECSVFPLPDDRFGETVCAALVLSTSAEVGVNNDVTPSVEEDIHLTKRIRQYCTTRHLASFKQPRRVFRVLKGVLPRNSSGKVLKHAVIKMCASNSKEISRL